MQETRPNAANWSTTQTKLTTPNYIKLYQLLKTTPTTPK